MMRGFKTITAIAAVLSFANAGCFDLKSVSQVEAFRVLGVSADPPEIAPGEGLRMSVLWADPEGDGRPVSFAWIGCAGLLKAPTAFESCEMVLPPVTGTAEEGRDSLEIPYTPEDILSYVPDMDFIKVTFIVLMCAGGELPAADEYASIGQMDDISTLCEGGDGIAAYKTVTVSNAEDPQRNPEIERLTVDEKALLPEDEGGKGEVRCTKEDGCGLSIDLSLQLTEDSAQTFTVQEDGETVSVNERLFTSWFVTNGDVDASAVGSKTDDPAGPIENVWKPESPGTHTLYVVAHDSRGGVSWQIYTVEVLPPR